MKPFATSVSVLTLLGGMLGIGGHLSRADVEHALRTQMNGGSAGTITRTVHCETRGAATTGSRRYLCTLTGVNGSHAQAIVTASNGSWRAAWAPLKG
jgi:hypothetical protein